MKLRSVQVLRAVAVCLVVLYHYGSLKNGEAGVDLFFVISGFIMVHVMAGKSAWSFAKARLWRIFPTLWAATLLLLLLPTGPATIDPDRLVRSLLLLPYPRYYLPQAWTLVYELVFYGCCAAYMLWGRRVFLILPAAYLFRDWHLPYAQELASPMFLEFLFGCAVAKLPRRYGWVSIGAAIVIFVTLNDLNRVLAFGVPAAFLLHGCVSLERHFNWPVPVLIGDASYSIYLTHWSFLALLPEWPMSGYWAFNAYLAVLLGLAFYLMIERPLIRLPVWWSSSRPVTQPGLPLLPGSTK